MSDRVRVCCRFRPLNAREERIKERPPLERVSDTKVKFGTDARKSELREWEYDRIFYPTSTQEDVYEYAARPILDSCFEGYNGTIFAYGQTGSGKTFSMVGPEEYVTNNALWGITPRLIHDLFARIADSPSHFQFSVKISYVELYRERLHDLLNMQNANLEIRQALNGDIFIKNVTEVYAGSADEVLNVFQRGDRNRFTAATTMNERSSRSHAILTLQLTQQDMRGEEGAKTSRIFLVDLAGSERLNDTQATGDRLKEAQQINQSLSALGNVIKALTDPKKRHVPYRDSKLTRLLQPALGGNSRTSLVICCSPSVASLGQTVSTLRFGVRAKAVKNQARVNEEFTKEQLLRQLKAAQNTIIKLRTYIQHLEAGGAPMVLNMDDGDDAGGDTEDGAPRGEQSEFILQQIRAAEMEAEIESLRSRLETARHDLSEAERSLSDCQGLNLELQEAALDTDARYNDAQEQLQKARLEVQQLQERGVREQQQLANTREELTNVTAEWKSLLQRYEEAEIRNKQMRDELSEAATKKHRFGKKKADEAMAKANEEHARLITQVESMRLELTSLRPRAARLEESLLAAKNENINLNAALMETIPRFQLHIKTLEAKNRRYAETLQFLQSYDVNDRSGIFIRGER